MLVMELLKPFPGTPPADTLPAAELAALGANRQALEAHAKG
jgi:hypothetical protein